MEFFKLLAILAGVAVAAVAGAIVRGNARLKRLQAELAQLPPEVRERALALIDVAGRKQPGHYVLFPGTTPDADPLLSSHHGGVPYAEAGETWPTLEMTIEDQEDAASGPAPFMFQVVLSAPDLPEAMASIYGWMPGMLDPRPPTALSSARIGLMNEFAQTRKT